MRLEEISTWLWSTPTLTLNKASALRFSTQLLIKGNPQRLTLAPDTTQLKFKRALESKIMMDCVGYL